MGQVTYNQLFLDTPRMTPSKEALEALPEEGRVLYSRAAEYLVEIDSQIELLDRILTRLQPPVSGRIRISWRREGDKPTARCRPMLVRWVRQGESWRSTKLGLKSLVQKTPKSGVFYDTKFELKEAVRELAWLLNRRSNFVDSMNSLEKAILYSCDRNEASLISAQKRIEDLEKRAALLPCTWRDGMLEEAVLATMNSKTADMSEEEREALIAMIP